MDTSSGGSINGLANIKKIVVLMFENRSFDHVFGAFPGVNGLMLNGEINKDYYNLAHPLKPPCSSSNPPIYPTPLDPTRPMTQDFTHDFGDGMMPDLFGPIFTVGGTGPQTPCNPCATYSSGYAKGLPTNQAKPGQTTYPATNSGFYSTYQNNTPQGQEVLTYFEHGALKVLPALAEQFVLCDNWHCASTTTTTDRIPRLPSSRGSTKSRMVIGRCMRQTPRRIKELSKVNSTFVF